MTTKRIERIALALILALILPASALAQSKLPSMPGYERFQRMSGEIRDAVVSGAISSIDWAEDGDSFTYQHAGRFYRFDIAAGSATEIPDPREQAGPGRGGRGGGPERGRQFTALESPDGSRIAVYRDRNLYITDGEGNNEIAVTTEGSEETRIKYGTASWVYGEELNQRTAFWWSPDGSKLAYYRFDESEVQDYYLQLDQTEIQSTLDIEAYPKAGTANPGVEVFVYDVATGESTRIDVRDGQPFAEDVVGYYVYGVGWSPDGSELTLNRTNRRQNTMEFAACDPGSGACRVVVREEWLPSWVSNSPTRVYLPDGHRFIWGSERNGYENLYLYDLSGELLATLTDHDFEVENILAIEVSEGRLWYTARDGANHLRTQLHRVNLDGTGHVRLTDPAFDHSVNIAPDGEHFIDVAQTHDTPPVTRLLREDGTVVATLAESDLTRFDELGLRRIEHFTFTAADGETPLIGAIHYPSNFDPSQRYPVLMPVYGGPASGSNTPRESFSAPHAYTEYGFIVVYLETRAAPGMGKPRLDAIYEKLGQVEIDDMAAGIRALAERPYVDGSRVGIYGTSYGGYSSLLAILRYPDVFAAASASSPVSDWRHYDTIYTERYMWTPQGNTGGYDLGSAIPYAENLEGDLLIYYGTADNNVHPSNSLQLIEALQGAGKSFEVQVGPDRGHTAVNGDRMMEFFIESLVLGR